MSHDAIGCAQQESFLGGVTRCNRLRATRVLGMSHDAIGCAQQVFWGCHTMQ